MATVQQKLHLSPGGIPEEIPTGPTFPSISTLAHKATYPSSPSATYSVDIMNSPQIGVLSSPKAVMTMLRTDISTSNATIEHQQRSPTRAVGVGAMTIDAPIAMKVIKTATFTHNSQSRDIIPTPGRDERKTQFGIDCTDIVHFSKWEPGGEHVKYLSIKNVVMKTQKIKYKLPQTRYFSMEFPETQTLSAGMSWTVPITFRPVAKATLPGHVLEFPPTMDFLLCPIRETAKKTFILKNTGELDSYFDWEISEPFSISPQTGLLASGSHCTVTIEFFPTAASVFTATVVCSFGDKARWEKSKVKQTLTAYGIGKYSHLTIANNSKVFNFGDVFIGRSMEKRFTLENHSVVSANFRIRHSEQNADPYFEFSVLSGTVNSKSSIEIKITYIPVASGMYSNEYFDIITLSGNTIRITCQGCGVGPRITITPEIVNFHDISANSTVTRALHLQNNSSTAALYQFQSEPESTFRIDMPSGTIGPNSSVSLAVKFSPTEPINYHRRVYCLVEHQDALFVDFIGTCYNEKRRPATFKPQHISNYQERVKNGLWQFGPEHLEEMLKSGTISCNKGVLSLVDKTTSDHNETRFLDSPYDGGFVGSEYFFENIGPAVAATLVNAYVDFGACSRYRIIEPRVIHISNNTKGKMSCVWVLPGDAKGDESVFSVTPRISDIPPKSTVGFKVNFRPNIDYSFYGAQLECFVYFKSMRTFRLVNEDTFTPSWCLTPTVAGNTFPQGEDTFIPKITFGATQLDFPACHVDKSVYRTALISNTGDTSVRFSFLERGATSIFEDQDRLDIDNKEKAIFSAKPCSGILHRGDSRLILFRFSPNEQREYFQELKCYFNSSLNNSYDLQMHGIGHYPKISFDGNGTLCFKPTCIGATSLCHFTIRNTSRIAVNFRWHIPRQYSSVVSIEPLIGVLNPNSSTELTCTFSPNSCSNFEIMLPCYYSHQILDETTLISRKRASFFIKGCGIVGTLVSKLQVVDLETILVDTIVEKEIVIFNPSECDVFYALEIYCKTQSTSDKGELKSEDKLIENSIKMGSELEIMQTAKCIPAKSNQALKIKACVHNQTQYEFSVYYHIDAHAISKDKGLVINNPLHSLNTTPRHHLCNIVATGVYPVVQATYIQSKEKQNFDHLAYTSKTLDDNLSLVDISQLRFNASENDIVFDFGATSVGCKPTVLNLSLTNSGVVPVDWMFHFPNDLEVEIEQWADPGNYTEEQLHQNLILDNNIFSVTPKRGNLSPEESVNIIMTYSHDFVGLHTLPVVFKLQNGKEIMISFTGYSVPPTKKYLQIQTSIHQLNPISIGVIDPPIQTYRLMNRGSVPLEYKIDTSSLDRLKQENHNFDIIRCLNPMGIIPAGGVEYIEWIFHPLEEKSYEVDIPISVSSSKTHMITIKGIGERQLTLPKTKLFDPKIYPDRISGLRPVESSNDIGSLSLENISFGHVPLGATMRQVVAIRNSHERADISFKWKIPEFWPTGEIVVTPSEGMLHPSESRICKVIFKPKAKCRIYDLDIVCDILNQTEMNESTAQKESLDRAFNGERRANTPDMQFSQERSYIRDFCVPPGKNNSKPGVDMSRLKYRPLPAITPPLSQSGQQTTLELQKRQPEKSLKDDDCRSIAREIKTDLRKVAPLQAVSIPCTSQKFVSIHARTYNVEEFRSLFKDYDHFFREHKLESPSGYEQDLNSVSQHDEKEAIHYAMQSLLSDVFQDPDVLDAPAATLNSPLPYYAQMMSCARFGILPLQPIPDYTAPEAEDLQINADPENLDKLGFEIGCPIIASTEFQNTVEAVLEGTLHNLIQEVNAGEFEWHRYPILFEDINVMDHVAKIQ
ncbi:hypothetical protein BASA60_004157 [Batrachochytrium salamandrivorans]|nr:hypothetical protein BASA60_004157 [Batrachochytrium salamandrivorans]